MKWVAAMILGVSLLLVIGVFGNDVVYSFVEEEMHEGEVVDGPDGEQIRGPVRNENAYSAFNYLTNEQVCTFSGGIFRECGSTCRGQDVGACDLSCAAYCECSSSRECPTLFTCEQFINGVGVCVAAWNNDGI